MGDADGGGEFPADFAEVGIGLDLVECPGQAEAPVLAAGLLPAKKGSTTIFVPLIFRENVA